MNSCINPVLRFSIGASAMTLDALLVETEELPFNLRQLKMSLTH